MSTPFKDTLGNLDWLRANEDKVKAMLPGTWTHMENVSVLKIGYQCKLLGIDWREVEDLPRILLYFEKIGFLLRQNTYQVRANPARVIPA